MPVRDVDTDSGARRELRSTTLPGLRWLELIDYLWDHRRFIFKWTAIGFALSLVLMYFIPKYEGTVQIMPAENGNAGPMAAIAALTAGPNVPGAGSLGDMLGLATKTPSSLYVKVLESESVQRAVVDRFDLRHVYGLIYLPKYHIYVLPRGEESARDKLDSRTKITEDKKSGVIVVVYKDRDPERAAAIANGYVDELNKVMARVNTSAAGREREFIEKRLADEKIALEDAEKQFSEFASKNMALDVPTQTRVMVESSAHLQGELAAARAQLAGLEQIYTPESSRVKTLRGQIGSLEHQLQEMNSGSPESAANNPTNPYPSVKTLPTLGVQWADLYRAQKVHETVYEYLTSQYESARIREAKDIATVKVLDQAIPPEGRAPRPWLVLFLGTAFFFLLACTGVEIERRWNAWDEDDPRRMMLLRFYRQGRLRTVGRLPWGRDRNGSGLPEDLNHKS